MTKVTRKSLENFSAAKDFQLQIQGCLRPEDDEHYERLMYILQYTGAMRRMFEAYSQGDLDGAEHQFRCAVQVFEHMRVARENWLIKSF